MNSYNASSNPFGSAGEITLTHETIAERARELWREQGCPAGCDEAIWLEAEAELQAIHDKRFRHPHLQLASSGERRNEG